MKTRFKTEHLIRLDRSRCAGSTTLPKHALGALSEVYLSYQRHDCWTARATARDRAGKPCPPHLTCAVRWDFAGAIGQMRIRYPEDWGLPGRCLYPAYKLALQTAQAEAWKWCRMNGWWPATMVSAMDILNDAGGYQEVMKVLSSAMRVLAHEAKLVDLEEDQT